MKSSDQDIDLDVEVKLIRTVMPIYAKKCGELGERFVDIPKGPPQSTTNILEFIASHDAESYRLMLDNDIVKVISTGSWALAYQEVIETHGEAFEHRPHYRAELEYENFLLRVVSTRDKSFQLWNAYRNSPLKVSDVTRGKIQKHLDKNNTQDDFFDELCAIWDGQSAKEIVTERNAIAHKYSLTALGIGYPIIGRPEKTKSGYTHYNIGGAVGKLDWNDAKKKIREACDFILDLRERIIKHLS